jgi:hypothetical protein
MDHSTQIIFDIIIAIAGFFGVFVLNQVMQKLSKHEERLSDLPNTFVRRDDYRQDMTEVKSMLHQIYDKLDGKADKPDHAR